MTLLVYTTSSPEIKFQETSSHLIVTFHSNLYFPAKDFIVRELNHKLQEMETLKVLIFDLSLVKSVDYSVALGLSGVLKSHENKDGSTVICCKANSVIDVLRSVHDQKVPFHAVFSLDQAIMETKC